MPPKGSGRIDPSHLVDNAPSVPFPNWAHVHRSLDTRLSISKHNGARNDTTRAVNNPLNRCAIRPPEPQSNSPASTAIRGTLNLPLFRQPHDSRHEDLQQTRHPEPTCSVLRRHRERLEVPLRHLLVD